MYCLIISMFRIKTEGESLGCFQTTKIPFKSLCLSWQEKEGRGLLRSLERVPRASANSGAR